MTRLPYPTQQDEALRRARVADRDPYSYQGRDRTAEAAVDTAARDGVRRCQCPHCSQARARYPLAAGTRE
ncbi:hypothetical protein ACIRVK_13745 [Streptomyces sp. NPDC101152]|uniref:hypothetical protein n=1 Tax=Streptomyces sp. NPDC101152 TaxID=3366116 RepID=UPI00381D236D